jgi:hypothetical protein
MSADPIAWAEEKAASWRKRAASQFEVAQHHTERAVDAEQSFARELYCTMAARVATEVERLEREAATLEALVAMVRERADA